MAIGDVYMCKDFQMFGSTELLNVYFYRANTSGLDALDLKQSFQSIMMPYITAAQVADLVHVRCEVTNLFSPTDIEDVAVSAAGGIAATTAELLPSFVAAPIRCNRQRADMRHGYKRICGLHEDVIQGNGWNNLHAQYTALVALATALTLGLDNPAGGDVEWKPVIVKRLKYTTSLGTKAWRLPTSQGELQYYEIASASLQYPTTQVTRKA